MPQMLQIKLVMRVESPGIAKLKIIKFFDDLIHISRFFKLELFLKDEPSLKNLLIHNFKNYRTNCQHFSVQNDSNLNTKLTIALIRIFI